MTETADEVQEVETRLKELTGYVGKCSARVTKGEMVDLSGLDRNVSEACAAAEALGSEKARAIAPQMEKLIGELDKLAIAIKEQQDNQTEQD